MANAKNSAALPDMATVFKSHPQPEVMKDMLSTYRNLATEHLQNTIPNKIKSLQELIQSESDPSSPLWIGHIDTAAYTKPVLMQPNDPSISDEVVRPSDVEGAKGVMDDEDGQGKTASHWFEVVPQNEIQDQLIRLSIKQHEELHMLTQDLRVWLELEVPVIEDGNSFGAEVQAHLIKELNDAIKRSNGFQNGARAHYGDRLQLAKEWVKYPNLRDYPAAIAASDRFDHFLLRSYNRSLLMIYGGLLTRFERNWTKVINPKGSGGGSGGMY